MSRQARNWYLAVAATSTVAVLASHIVWPQPGQDDFYWPWPLGLTAFPIAAALILSRRPGNAIGLTLGVVSLSSLVIFATWGYVGTFPSGPLSPAAEVLNNVFVIPQFGGMIALLHVFPTGRPPNRLFQAALRVFWWAIAATSVLLVLSPGDLPITGRDNPAGVLPEWTGQLVSEGGVWDMTFVIFILVGLISLVVRWRRGEAVERAQLRWFITAALISVLFLTLSADESASAGTVADIVIGVLLAIGLFWSLPAAIVVAVLRYRLFEIDRLISRTLTYALVAGLMAATFAAIAIGLPTLLGLSGESPQLVAGATLAAAALFNPLRRRLQTWVDRRFNRARYDAQQEVASLTERLRDELDVADLTGDMIGVVAKTMQPASASVWVREGDR